jgi:hypothetical protein
MKSRYNFGSGNCKGRSYGLIFIIPDAKGNQ